MEKRPFTIVIIGGKLQGTESVYLAKKAGFHTVLIDRSRRVPASGLCDEFICADIAEADHGLIHTIKNCDLILPACENRETLNEIQKLSQIHNLQNIAFDFKAYDVSSSKFLSDRLFSENRIPVPLYYPNCKAPYIVKPSESSGSAGVQKMHTIKEVEEFLSSIPKHETWIVQEYLTGRSYSIEVIGKPGSYRTYQITEIHMDEVYDCNQVTSPCNISDKMKKELSDIAVKLADLVGLNGIMDVEVIDDEGILKVLEIDARIPSQTPTAVYHSTGINFISEIASLFSGKWETQNLCREKYRERYTSYEHYYVDNNGIKCLGEHIMSDAGPLKLYTNYLGSDEVITDYRKGDKVFRGTFINSDITPEKLETKRSEMKESLKRVFMV